MSKSKSQKLTLEQQLLISKIPIAKKKKIKSKIYDVYALPSKYKGISYPKIKMGQYIIVAYLYAKEKKYFASQNFRNQNIVYVNGAKIGLTKLDKKIGMSDKHNLNSKKDKNDEESGTIGGKRPYTEFGKFLFKSWDWVEQLDVDRFIILYYPDEEDRKKASALYFNNPDATVCDGLDYDFMRLD